ncbi:MAG: trimethylamine methyltransferase family protein [Alphaproteobacteria bacterium]|jgi:trimethylamine--corrinoid protein Co-methyltransferase|nr:trimethylamine methyltransferase family protein [Alphaproteobacteria bacterium]
MLETAGQRRRNGGRAARRLERAAPGPSTAIAPGLQGGAYRPLAEADVARIHRAALEILETIGLADAIPSCVRLLTEAGGWLTAEGRLCLPAALVEDVIARANRDFVLPGQRPEHDLAISERRVHYGTAGAAVNVIDIETGAYRDSSLRDLYDIARLVDSLDNVHFFQRPVVARDVLDERELDLNTCYACIAGTAKHVGTSFTSAEGLEEAVRMLDYIAGGEGAFRRRPFVSLSCCFVVPPLRFAEDACRTLEAGVRAGMPVLLLSAGQAGATSPAALAGAVAQGVAEVLAGLVYVDAISPGHPAIFGTWPFVSDLRTGAMSGGSGEQALLMAAAAQMAVHYGLPSGVATGMADAKIPDAQSGYEKGYTTALAGLAGANLVYEAAGMQASLLGASFESYVIDNDMLGAVLRQIRGIEVTEDSLSVEVMREVVSGPAHYLTHPQTLRLMQQEYVYPRIADRKSPDDWLGDGGLDIRERARQEARAILARHYPRHLPPEIDAEIRRRLPIRLPVESMRQA